jgi:agmatinase
VTDDRLPINFLGLEPQEADPATATYVILPIPYDATTTFLAGTRHGPRAIIEASQHLEDYDEELQANYADVGIVTVEPIAPHHAGPDAMQQRIRDLAGRLVEQGKFVFALGGEHSITPPLVAAAMSKYPKLSVLQIDAHGDLRAEYNGTPCSHACAMRQVVELGACVVGVGIRSLSEDEPAFAKQHGVRHFLAREIHDNRDWIEPAVEALASPVYVTIDIDAFDPACAPGTGTPEPGGLDYYAVCALLRRVAERHQIVGADCVEVIPLPGQRATEFLAARLVYKLIAYREHPRRR